MKDAIFKLLLAVLAIVVLFGILRGKRSQSVSPNPSAPPGLVPTVLLKGASQFDEEHAFTRTLRRFENLVKTYSDVPVAFELYLNSELGVEKDYFAYMSQGTSLDYGIVSPSHMSTFSSAAPLVDMPFLFRDLDHWEKSLSGDALQPIVDDVLKQADVRIIGYAGGGVRNLIVNRPVTDVAALKSLDIRVMGAPIQTRIFQALGASPTVIAYSEVYNAIQTGVIDAAENEAAGIQQKKFYEVGPEIALTRHAITVRPICFSEKTLRKLAPSLQAAILRAGAEAGAYGRQIESQEDSKILAQMESEGKLRTHPFSGRETLLKLAQPVKEAYAEEIGAAAVLERINAVQ